VCNTTNTCSQIQSCVILVVANYSCALPCMGVICTSSWNELVHIELPGMGVISMPSLTKLVHTELNYDRHTELHAPKIIVTTAHIKSSQSSLAVAW
jgi:hypothetical protein